MTAASRKLEEILCAYVSTKECETLSYLIDIDTFLNVANKRITHA